MYEIYGYNVLVDDQELFFKERVTAQWAVFFNALGVTFAHVPESFGRVGLPDFWLPQAELWAIVTDNPRQLTTSERVGCETLVKTNGYGCLLLLGQPEYKPYSIIYESPLDIVANDGFTILKTLKLPLDETHFQYEDHLLSVTRGRWYHCEPEYSFVSEHDAEWYPKDMDFHLSHERFSDLQNAVDASQQGTLIQTLTRQVRSDNPIEEHNTRHADRIKLRWKISAAAHEFFESLGEVDENLMYLAGEFMAANEDYVLNHSGEQEVNGTLRILKTGFLPNQKRMLERVRDLLQEE